MLSRTSYGARPIAPLAAAVLLAAIALFAPTVEAAEKRERPNILFAIADDASFPHMSAYGCDWIETPGFDRVAERGLLFTRAYTPNAKCAPSRACILTGRNSWQLEEAANHWCYFPAKFKVYPEALAEHGYHVGATGKGWAPGIAKTEDGERRHLAGKPYRGRRTQPPAKGISGIDYAGNFKDFLDAQPDGEPFCFWYGGYEPHRRYEYGAGVSKGGKKLTDIDRVPDIWPDNETVRNDMLDYAFEIEYFDSHLVRMLNELERRGELANTLVVVTADNGMPFPRVKGQEFEHSNHLPLAIMWPAGIENPGRVVEDYVSFIDFAPTFVEVAGLKWDETGLHPTPGRSLTDIFESGKAGQVNPARDHVVIGKERHDIGRPHDWGYPIRGIVADDVLYLKNFEPDRWPAGNPETGYLNTDASPTKTAILDGRTEPGTHRFWSLSFGKRPQEQLYRLRRDPYCINNLADDARYAGLKKRMRDRLLKKLEQQNDPRVRGNGEVFDNYPYANERQRNFYGKFMEGELNRESAGWVNPSDFEDAPLD